MFSGRRWSERKAATALVLGCAVERELPFTWLFALHLNLGIDVCMRLSRSSLAPAQAFFDREERSRIVTLTQSAKQRRACRDQALPAEPIRVRLVRVHLRGGETEVSATSVLEEERLPARLFGALDHQRWSAEEHIKRQKRWAEVENLSGTRCAPAARSRR